MNEKTIPDGATHIAEFCGDVIYYRVTIKTRYNSVIDHPQECWQKYQYFEYYDYMKWNHVGDGFSARRLKPIGENNESKQTQKEFHI